MNEASSAPRLGAPPLAPKLTLLTFWIGVALGGRERRVDSASGWAKLLLTMLFRQLFDAPSGSYSYLLADENTREAVLIDPVFEQHRRDLALLNELELKLLYTVDTHCHADHVTGAWLMKAEVGSQIALSRRVGAEGVDRPLAAGDTLVFGSLNLQARATPGHTDGCMTFVTGDQAMAFTGDCLLIRGAGRTDFQQGSARTMYQSIQQQIFALPDSCLIYPAHDYEGRTVSTVAEEKAFNARVGGGASERDFVGYMDNLDLPHPKKIDVALPANMRCGKPLDGVLPQVASWGPVVITYAGVPEIAAQWVAEHRPQVHVLDVSTQAEFDDELGHIEGSQLIELGQLKGRIDEVPRDKPVVTVCRSGRRSALATVLLRNAGLEAVASLRGGLLRWRELQR